MGLAASCIPQALSESLPMKLVVGCPPHLPLSEVLQRACQGKVMEIDLTSHARTSTARTVPQIRLTHLRSALSSAKSAFTSWISILVAASPDHAVLDCSGVAGAWCPSMPHSRRSRTVAMASTRRKDRSREAPAATEGASQKMMSPAGIAT